VLRSVMEKALEEVYSDPRQPGSFGGVEKLRKGLKKSKNVHATVKDVKKWLTKKDTYTKHRTARKNFPRNRIIAPYIDAQWQGDLAEVGDLAGSNDGVRYLLIVIDIVSKYVWVEALKTKRGEEVLSGFRRIFQRTLRRPDKLQTDDGTEFWYQGLQRYLKAEGIKFFTLKSDKKAAVAERVVRTLKEKIWRYMHEKHVRRYIDVLQDLVASYNDTEHDSIGMPPSAVNESNESEVLRSLYGSDWISKKNIKKKKSESFKKGDFVRISKLKGKFEKGFRGNFSEELFVVNKVKPAHPYTLYELRDWDGEILQGSFYDKELQLVNKDLSGHWKVEAIIDSRKVGRRTQYLVKWEGYPDSMNQWVDEKDIKQI
jgi:hypothetical protein